ncbi:hypothetical protein ABB02_02016 [Clostridiaceae bacterium JG1575]|nr:hypothetical protein ABB02_02016 [Clostridiaceae bacterium JG1575]
MKKYFSPPALIVTLGLTGAMAIYMQQRGAKIPAILVGCLIFFVLNLLVFTFYLRALAAMFRILNLPDRKLNTYAFHLYPVALTVLYAAFLLGMARMANAPVPPLALAITLIGGIVLTLFAQLGGAFADVRKGVKKEAIRMENAGGVLGGFEILGSLTGSYKDGIILGYHTIAYDRLETMHRAQDSIIIEGSGDPKTELIIISKKAQPFLVALLQDRLKTSRSALIDPVSNKKSKTGPSRAKNTERKKPVKLVSTKAIRESKMAKGHKGV